MALPKSLGKNTPGSADKSIVNATHSDQLQTLEQTGADIGKAPKERMRNAQALSSLYQTLLQADNKRAFNRTLLENVADGAAPQDEAMLEANGLSWVYNLNFLEGDTQLQGALTAYSDLIESENELIIPEFDPAKIAPEEVNDAADVIAEEHSKLIREGSNFYFEWERLGSEFTKFGVGFSYFPDEEAWEWNAAGWREFLMPNRTKASEDKIPVIMWQHDYRVHELYKCITDTDHTNWDVEEVKKAIVFAARSPTRDRPWMTFWPEIEMLLKNQDLAFSYGQAEEVKALHALVREFDGSVSFYVSLINSNNTRFLYKDVGRYKKMTEAVITYTLGVGNGTYHSIRGLLWKMYPFIQASNRIQNKLLTQTDLAMSLHLQAVDAESLDDMAITLNGPVAYLPPSDKAVVVDRKIPDVGTQGLPVIEHVNSRLSNATGQFQSSHGSVGTTTDNRHNVSKFQYQAEEEKAGSLTNNSVNRFYRSLDRTVSEQFRRIQKISPSDSRFPEVGEFYQRCKERGVTADVVKKAVRKVTARRAIGNGSPQMRALALDELAQTIGFLDETGRNLAVRDRISVRFGRLAADRYLPKQKRMAPDVQVAVLENTILKTDNVPVLPDQNHAVHAGVHVPVFQKAVEQLVAAREQNPEQDFAPLQPILQYAFNLHAHSADHVQAMAADPSRAKDAKAYAAALEQGGNLLAGFARELQAQERHQVGAPAGQPGAPAQAAPGAAPTASAPAGDQQAQYDQINASDPRLALQAQRQQEELVQKRELHQKELELASAKVSEVAQRMRMRDIETAAKIKGQFAASQSEGATATPV